VVSQASSSVGAVENFCGHQHSQFGRGPEKAPSLLNEIPPSNVGLYFQHGSTASRPIHVHSDEDTYI